MDWSTSIKTWWVYRQDPHLITPCSISLAAQITPFKGIPRALPFEEQDNNCYRVIYLDWDGVTTTFANACMIFVKEKKNDFIVTSGILPLNWGHFLSKPLRQN